MTQVLSPRRAPKVMPVAVEPQIARHPPPTSFNLVREVRAYHNAKPIGPRRHGIHPSGLPYLCPVKFAIYEQTRLRMASEDAATSAQARAQFQRILSAPTHRVSPGGRFDAKLLMEFRGGHDIHKHVQFDLGVVGKLWGQWVCPRCEATTEAGQMPRAWYPSPTKTGQVIGPAPCVRCKGGNLREDAAWLYKEPWVYHGHYSIVGAFDGDVRVVRGKWSWRCLLEIKSINENGYYEKYGSIPSPEHVLQASVYAWLAGFSWIMFIYVDKNALHKWKEVIIPVDTVAVSHVLAKLEAIKWYREAKQLPLHARVCEDIQCKRARGCPVVAQCWGKEPPRSF